MAAVLMEKERNRTVYLDMLRFVACLGVIHIHVSDDEFENAFLSYNWYISIVNESIVHWAVPIFVMISGALFLNPNKEISINKMWVKYIPRLFKLYFFWIIFYAVIQILLESIEGSRLIISPSFFLPYYHLWFLPLLIIIYMMVPFLRRISSHEKILEYTIILGGVFVALSSYVYPEIVEIKQLRSVSKFMNPNLVLSYTIYFILGYYLSIVTFNTKQKYILYTLGLAGICLSVIGNIFISLNSNTPSNRMLNDTCLHTFFVAMSIFVLFKSMEWNWIQRFIEKNRDELLGIYLIHPLFLLCVDISFIRNAFNHVITIPVISITVFVISLVSIKILRKIPLIQNYIR